MTNKNKKLIIGVMPGINDGCQYYRITRPYEKISQLGLAEVVFIETKDLEDEYFADFLRQCDYLVCRPSHAGPMLNVIDKHFDVKIILDTDDDLFNIDPYSEAYGALGVEEVRHNGKWLWKDGETIDLKENKENVEMIKKFYKRANIITTTTERLRKNLLNYNKNVIVNPNAIDYNYWIHRELVKDDTIRIGWTGGASHYADWMTVQKDVERIMKEFPNVKLVIGGTLFPGIFKNIDKSRIEHYEWVDPVAHGFRTMLMNLDIAFCPLKLSEFNSNKSNVKFYEFSALRIPTLCSNVPPYSDEIPKELLFDSLYDSIKPLIESKEKRDKVSEITYNWIRAYREQGRVSEELLYNILKLHKSQKLQHKKSKNNLSKNNNNMKFPESKLAHEYLDGLKGLEIGGGAHNSFGLDTLNVDYTDDMNTYYKEMEEKQCGEKMPVDIVAPGDKLPVKDESYDFVISSHTIEHIFDTIGALKEWYRVIRKDGYIFIIIPTISAVPGEIRPVTTLKELIDRHEGRVKEKDLSAPYYDHWTVFDSGLFREICDYLGYNLIRVEEKDDKVGNGFTTIIKKK